MLHLANTGKLHEAGVLNNHTRNSQLLVSTRFRDHLASSWAVSSRVDLIWRPVLQPGTWLADYPRVVSRAPLSSFNYLILSRAKSTLPILRG